MNARNLRLFNVFPYWIGHSNPKETDIAKKKILSENEIHKLN